MKKYISPTIEIEKYEMSSSIASNCAVVVTNGPIIGNHITVCSDYNEFESISLFSKKPHNVEFYEDTCDCYTTGGDTGYWTS